MILAEFLPERLAADIVAGRIRLRFRDDEFVLGVLSIDDNERWQEKFRERIGELFAGFAKLDDPNLIMARFASATQLQLDMLHLYDAENVLPDDANLRKVATPDALLRAVLEVLAASYPPLAIALDLIVRNPESLRGLMDQGMATMATSSTPTNGSRRPTAGTRKRSGVG